LDQNSRDLLLVQCFPSCSHQVGMIYPLGATIRRLTDGCLSEAKCLRCRFAVSCNSRDERIKGSGFKPIYISSPAFKADGPLSSHPLT
jgi:hypothetical protein